MFCMNCGVNIDFKAVFCPSCGENQSALKNSLQNNNLNYPGNKIINKTKPPSSIKKYILISIAVFIFLRLASTSDDESKLPPTSNTNNYGSFNGGVDYSSYRCYGSEDTKEFLEMKSNRFDKCEADRLQAVENCIGSRVFQKSPEIETACVRTSSMIALQCNRDTLAIDGQECRTKR